ncbi:MAG: hypothetical protein AAB448_01020 [Patescibacteria group bacterium]
MKLGGIIIGGVCAIVASVISVHLFFDPAPEFRMLTSGDGRLFVEGLVYESQQFSVEDEEAAESLFPLSSSRYLLAPIDATFVQPLEGSFLIDADRSVLYQWNDTDAYWTALQSSSVQGGCAYVFVSVGGLYALGTELSIDMPTFVDVVSDLRSRLLENAVSYRIRLVATPSGGVPVLLGSFLEQGGCGGIPTAGDQELLMQEERTVQVLVNDVLTMTSFTFLMEIDTAPEGCPEDMPMQVIF